MLSEPLNSAASYTFCCVLWPNKTRCTFQTFLLWLFFFFFFVKNRCTLQKIPHFVPSSGQNMSEPRVLAFVDLCAIGARLGVPPHRFVFVDLVAAAVRQQCVDRRRSSSLQIVRYAGIADIHGKLRTIAPLEDLMQADQHVLQLSLEVLTHCHCLRGTPEWVVQGLAESLCLVDATMDARQKAMIVASWIPSCASLPSPSAFPLPFTGIFMPLLPRCAACCTAKPAFKPP